MFSVCGLWLDPNIGVRPAADKKFYLGLTVDKMHAFVVFTEKLLRPNDCSDANFKAVVSSTNPNTEIKCEIIEIEIIETHI